MEKTEKTIVKPVIFLLLFLFLGILTWSWATRVLLDMERDFSGLIQLRFNSEALSGHQAEEIYNSQNKKEEGSALVFWTEKKNISVVNEDFNRKITADILYCFGDADSTFTLYKEGGCSLPADLAYDLWGTEDVIGRNLLIDDRSYTIERLLPKGQGYAAVKVGSSDDEAFHVMNITPREYNSLSSEGTEITNAYGLNPDMTMDYTSRITFIGDMGKLLLWLLIIVILGIELWKTYRQIRKSDDLSHLEMAQLFFSQLGVCAGLLLFGVLVIGIPSGLPDFLVPTKWSDFEFWGSTASRLKEEFHTLTSMEAYGPDAAYRGSVLAFSCREISAVIFFLLAWYYFVKFPSRKTSGLNINEQDEGRRRVGIGYLKKYYERVR